MLARRRELQRERIQEMCYAMGEVAAAVYNVNRDVKRRPKPWNWLDIFPEWKPKPKPQTEDEMLQAMEAWAHLSNVNAES